MNIAFVNIWLRPWMDNPCFPLGFAYVVSAAKRAGYGFDLIDIEAHRHTDEQLEEALGKKSYDVIALGTLVSGYKYAKRAAEIGRKTNPQAIIVAGNSVASSIPDHLLTHTEVDVAVKGEADITIVKLLSALAKRKSIGDLRDVKGLVCAHNGEIFDTGYEDIIKDISSISFPDWDLFDMDLYLSKAIKQVLEPAPLPMDQIRAFIVNTARGCINRCGFCYHVFHYTRYRYRSAQSIVSEIATLQERFGVNYVNFFDELTFASRKQVREFIDAVKKSRLKFFWNACVRGNLFSEKDRDLLLEAKETGCLSMGSALESADPDILRSMNKKVSLTEFKRQQRLLQGAGILTGTSLVLGYPQETPETLKKTFDVCYELNIYPSVGYLLPQPGTPAFELAKQKGFGEDLESFLMAMGDRQDLRFNLTDMPDDVFQEEVANHLLRISDKMGLGLTRENVIKTGTPRLSLSDEKDD